LAKPLAGNFDILAKKRRIKTVPDLAQQLAQLRQRVTRIDRKYQAPDNRKAASCKPARFFIEEWAAGQVVENEYGPHFQMEKLYEGHRRHGSADIGALQELPHDFLKVLSEEEFAAAPPARWAFLDTETTGLAGGTGTYAFLIGVGRITPEGFALRQFFLREYAEEKSLLAALAAHLEEFDVLVTYNGKAYDQPLLETRYRMNRQPPPFGRLPHIDLLHGARRIWKWRFENCRLSHLERQVLGFEREGDLPGELIPYVYFEYLRSGEAQRLVPIFHHNAIDILTLACLAALVPAAFRATDSESLAGLGFRRGEEYVGIARWYLAGGDAERALDLFRRAIDTGLPDHLLFRTLWDIAVVEKRCERITPAVAVFGELASCKNAHQADALIELSKYYEHTERKFPIALEFAQKARDLTISTELERRIVRLETKIARPRSRRLL
jgi:uncharacterized protein YprB with RNaseH-like and TPR domain